MHSLTHGFLFIVGLSWLLGETCVGAGNGNWTPLWLFLAMFVIMFAIMGCLPLKDKTINLAGPVFTILIGLGIIAYGVAAFPGSLFGGALRCIGGIALAVLGGLEFGSHKSEEAHSH